MLDKNAMYIRFFLLLNLL